MTAASKQTKNMSIWTYNDPPSLIAGHKITQDGLPFRWNQSIKKCLFPYLRVHFFLEE